MTQISDLSLHSARSRRRAVFASVQDKNRLLLLRAPPLLPSYFLHLALSVRHSRAAKAGPNSHFRRLEEKYHHPPKIYFRFRSDRSGIKCEARAPSCRSDRSSEADCFRVRVNKESFKRSRLLMREKSICIGVDLLKSLFLSLRNRPIKSFYKRIKTAKNSIPY